MEPGHIYVSVSPEALLLIGFLMFVLFMLIVLLAGAVDEINKPRAHEQRLMQMQMTKQQALGEMDRLTQDYVQRKKDQAQSHRPHTHGEKNRTPSTSA